MARNLTKPLVVSMGDPAGIGPEIIAKSWTAFRNGGPQFCVVGSIKMLRETAGLNNDMFVSIEAPEQITDVFHRRLPVIEVYDDLNAAEATIESIKIGTKLCLEDKTQALITAPISKKPLYDAGFNHPGHTEFLGELTKDVEMETARGPVMMLSGGGLRVALTTVHLPLYKVRPAITKERVMRHARVLHHSLKNDFGITAPRIAMAGLNPHAGENGSLGKEEIKILNPAAQELRNEGINITDAQPADTMFHADARKTYDAVLAMYHDQGLIPVKTLDFHGGINITLGLPIIRTSPDHGTAYNLAGKGIARADSMIMAIKTARQLADSRLQFRYG